VRCDCGLTLEVRRVNLLKGSRKSCGCLQKERGRDQGQLFGGHNRLDLRGQTFGRLQTLGPAQSLNGKTCWLCRCACGRETTVPTRNLRSGQTKSCGCLLREKRSFSESG
jgi:hypothetical protein